MDTLTKRTWSILSNGGLVLAVLGAALSLLHAYAGLLPSAPVWLGVAIVGIGAAIKSLGSAMSDATKLTPAKWAVAVLAVIAAIVVPPQVPAQAPNTTQTTTTTTTETTTPAVAPDAVTAPASAPVEPGDVPAAGEDAGGGPLAFLGAILGAVLPVGCSAAQQAVFAASGGQLADCLLNCGANAAAITVQSASTGATINGAGIGWSALGCALPCLAQFGVVAVTTAALPPARYGGSAGERNVYMGDAITITITPRNPAARAP